MIHTHMLQLRVITHALEVVIHISHSEACTMLDVPRMVMWEQRMYRFQTTNVMTIETASLEWRTRASVAVIRTRTKRRARASAAVMRTTVFQLSVITHVLEVVIHISPSRNLHRAGCAPNGDVGTKDVQDGNCKHSYQKYKCYVDGSYH
jgi:hypothetical protein